MSDNGSNRHVIMKPAPIIWAHLIKPKPGRVVNGNMIKPQFEVTWIFDGDHPDFLALKEMYSNIAHSTFGGERVAIPKGAPGALGMPFERGDKLADAAKAREKDREFLRGKVMFTPHGLYTRKDGSLARPPKLIVAGSNGRWSEYEDEAERPAAGGFFYNGCLCRGEVSLVAYPGMGGGVSAYLNEIVSLNSGQKIAAGSSDAESKYGPVASMAQYMGTVSSVDPTQGIQF